MKHQSLRPNNYSHKAHTLSGNFNSRFYFLGILLLLISLAGRAQTVDTTKVISSIKIDSSNGLGSLSIQQCINYALIHHPLINEAVINVEIARTTNKINLAAWLPQVNASGQAIHYIQNSTYTSADVGGTSSTPTASSPIATRETPSNLFIPELTASQTIFNPSLMYAAKAAPLLVTQAQEVTDSTKIYLVSAVSLAYYNLLQTLEQINVLKEDTARLGRNLRDAYNQYVGGIVDETDWEEAEISLNNSVASLKQENENIVPQYAVLKQLMGYAPEKQFNVAYDTLQMKHDIYIDTAKQLSYQKRIEYQQIKTQQSLQDQEVNYYRLAWLPTISAFYDYELTYENNRLSDLLATSYPSQLVGLSLNIPIFTGFSRVNSVKKAKLQRELLDWQESDLKSQIYTQYTTALASYKSNLFNFSLLKKNVDLAKRTYFVVELQYRQGIVAYLNVITAESNLISSEISYVNALFQVLSSKIDLEKAMGDITY